MIAIHAFPFLNNELIEKIAKSVYDVESNAQKFIPVPEHGDGISALTVSADRMMMAVAEASQTKPSISIFELNSHRKRKTLHAENSTAKVPELYIAQFTQTRAVSNSIAK